jgi:adenylate cyclase
LLLSISSNVFGSVFSILYNGHLIVNRHVPENQQWVFWLLGLSIYNPLAYVACSAGGLYALAPLLKTHRRLLRGDEVAADDLQRCRRTLLHFPLVLALIVFVGWLGGGIFFPSLVCSLADVRHAGAVWGQFVVSFGVSGLVTTAQTFFLAEEFLIVVLYPLYFNSVRPSDVEAFRLPFYSRLLLLWGAVAFVPLLAMLVIAMNVSDAVLRGLSMMVFFLGGTSGGFISLLVGASLLRWLTSHSKATQRIARQIFHPPVREHRPDEWGTLTARFNDMAGSLADAQRMRETFGQIVHPDVRDAVMQRFQGLGGEVCTITVLFVDIRGFTPRCADQPPEAVVDLLNRFLSLAVTAVEQGGVVNKFLGDGAMAIFGAPKTQPDQADRAVQAALRLLERLDHLNRQLLDQQQPPLQIGIGIHTGPAVVGCIGAVIHRDDQPMTMRREFTAIGDTVNLAQRLEQLTKTAGGPILISDGTFRKLATRFRTECLGVQAVKGSEQGLHVYRVDGYGVDGIG